MCSVPVWQAFLNTSVVDAVKTLLQQGDFCRAAYIWTTSLVSLDTLHISICNKYVEMIQHCQNILCMQKIFSVLTLC